MQPTTLLHLDVRAVCRLIIRWWWWWWFFKLLKYSTNFWNILPLVKYSTNLCTGRSRRSCIRVGFSSGAYSERCSGKFLIFVNFLEKRTTFDSLFLAVLRMKPSKNVKKIFAQLRDDAFTSALQQHTCKKVHLGKIHFDQFFALKIIVFQIFPEGREGRS